MISAENISYSYTSGKNVFEKLSFHIKKGEFCALLGHNGSGKSTLAKHFNAILIPSDGNIFINGMNTRDEEHLFEIRANAGMVFQNPDNQIVTTIVEDEVAFAPENLGVPPDEIRRRVDDALAAVGMSDAALKSTAGLSGGQKQKLAIASALAMQPECIIFDEPTAMLDPIGRREIMNTVHKLNREKGITIIFITHYMIEAAEADRVIVMNKGEILLDDTPYKVFANTGLLKKIGLGVPQPAELAAELRKRGVDMPENILFPEECADALLKIIQDMKQ